MHVRNDYNKGKSTKIFEVCKALCAWISCPVADAAGHNNRFIKQQGADINK